MTKISIFAFYLMGAILLGGVPSLVAQQVLPREDIKTFSQDPAKLKKLRDAVASLQSRGLDNSTSWFTMAGIHDIRPNDPNLPSVPASIQALFHQCHGDESLFFLWHRAYVASLERLFQDAINDPSFRLPYWNWYSDPTLPEVFRNEFLDAQSTQKNSLYIANRRSGVNAGNPIWKPEIVTDYTNPDFDGFQNGLNGNEHGDIHVFVGTPTNMGSIFFAARDPIFYLHHANIDRLLMVWLKSDPNTHHVPADFPAWLPSVYRFPVLPATTGGATPNVNTPTIQQLALGSMEAMGYRYDNVDLPSVPTPPLPTAPQNIIPAESVPAQSENAPKIQAFSATKGIVVGAGGTVELTIQPSHKAKMSSLADFEPSTKSGVGLTIVFENIQVKEVPPGLASYRVFVNLPKDGAAKESFKDHFVGTISLFGLQHGAEHGHGTVKLRISASSGAVGLKKGLAGSGDGPAKISISLLPVMAPDASAPKIPVLSIGQIRLEGNEP